MASPELFITAAILISFGLLLLVRRRIAQSQETVRLRPLPALRSVRRQAGLALESGKPPLIALGHGSLHTAAGPVSVAALQLLQEMAESSGRGQLTPQLMLGAATLLPLVQDGLNAGRATTGDAQDTPLNVQFVAEDGFPITYGAGASVAIESADVVSSVAVGRFGAEIALIGEAASRNQIEQLMGSDDPSAIAVAIASTENSLWGEEIFAAGAYLRDTDWHRAAIRTQDLLRWILIAALSAAAAVHLLGLA